MLLLAILRVGDDDAYGVPVAREIEALASTSVPMGRPPK
jgi:hypothetical protein